MAEAYGLMEYKLLYFIIHPAMLMTIVLGLILMKLHPEVLQAPWFHAKLAGVFLLIGYQVFAGITYRKFKKENYFLSEKACRWINEVPTVLLIVIILLVELKPGF